MKLRAIVVGIALASVVLLGSCGDNAYHRFTKGDFDRLQEAHDLADVANANAGYALRLCDDLDSRVSNIESRLSM